LDKKKVKKQTETLYTTEKQKEDSRIMNWKRQEAPFEDDLSSIAYQ
jgi:hypothetical protein